VRSGAVRFLYAKVARKRITAKLKDEKPPLKSKKREYRARGTFFRNDYLCPTFAVLILKHILPVKNGDGFERYLRIIGTEESAEELYRLTDSFSTLFLH
jgi:hypothetical protein